MKKKAVLLILVLLFFIFLSACECRHEWEEATCLKPRTCAECGETQGEASGHSWQEANCETPKTCSVCEETDGTAIGHSWGPATCETPEKCEICGAEQGDPLPHGYGKWSISGEEMTRSCSICSKTETTALDRETYFRSNSAGHWDADAIYTQGEWYNPYALGSQVGVYLYMDGETIRFFNGKRQFEGSYTFQEFEQTDGTDIYRFLGEFEDGNELPLTYCEEGEKATIIFGTQEHVLLLVQNSLYTEAMAGCWGNIIDNNMVYLQLNEDRTFQADFQGPFSGTWHVRPVHEKDGIRYMEFILTSPDMGYQNNYVFKRYFNNKEETELPQLLKVEPNSTTISCYYGEYNRNYIILKSIDKEQLELQADQLKEGLQNILGTWVSRERSVMSKQYDYSNIAAMVGYEFTFLEDGTFCSVLEEEKTGTWEYLDKPNDYARFMLYFDDNPTDKSWSLDLYDDGRMTVFHYGETENINYKFEKKQERVVYEGELPLVGTWYATVYHVYDPQTQKESSTTRKDDFITLNEDGTLTAYLGEECNGIWEYESSMMIDENTQSPEKMDTYKLIINGKEEPYHVNFREKEGTFNLNYFNYEDGRSYSCEFIKGSAEEKLDFIENGMETILGDWVSTEYMENSLSGGNETVYEYTDQYTVSIHADGTFDYQYHEKGSGTWLYDGYDESSNQLTYTFQYYEPYPFSYRYCLDKEDVLFGWFETGNSRIGYYFERAK